MRLDQNPLFRRVIIPWYDSDALCIIVIVLMFFVLLFSIAGIFVVFENIDYRNYLWLPGLLIMLSGSVFILTSIRLSKRHRGLK